VGITDGYTNPYGNTSLHYPVTAEFAKIEHENAAWGCCAYKAAIAGGGIRSKLQAFVSIPSNGTDSFLAHAMLLAGDLGVRNLTSLQAYQTEYNSPPSPTVNAGSGVSFNYDDGSWHATASGTPSLDITTTGTMTSPAFLISSWNNTVPNVSIGGVAQTANVGFVYANTDATHLLVQLVGLPTNGSGGMTSVPNSTRVIITAGALPGASGSVITPGTKLAPNTKIAENRPSDKVGEGNLGGSQVHSEVTPGIDGLDLREPAVDSGELPAEFVTRYGLSTNTPHAAKVTGNEPK